MSIKNMLGVLLKEAETYRIHGLWEETRLKYHRALEILKANEQLEDRKALIQILERKVTDNTRREAYYKAMTIIEAGEINGHYRFDYQLP